MSLKTKISTDLAIIGGGPAGCAAALSARQAGVNNITIIEGTPKNRHRVGEILLTNTIHDISKLGIADDLHPYIEKYGWNKKFAAAYVHGKDRTPWQVVNNHPGLDQNEEDGTNHPIKYVDEVSGIWFTLMVRRHEFDLALREICLKKGIDIVSAKVSDVKFLNKESPKDSTVISVLCIDKDERHIKISPKFLIDASGQNAVMGHQRESRINFGDKGLRSKYTYFSGVNFDDPQEKGFYMQGANIISFENGWAWIAHLGRGQTSVGIVSKNWCEEKDQFWEKLKRLPEYKLFGLHEAKVVSYDNKPTNQSNYYSHQNYRYKTENFYGTNWCAAGDAAIFLDPLLSQGVTLSISYGKKLGAIASDILNDIVDPQKALSSFHQAYLKEIEILNKVISLWYEPDVNVKQEWEQTAKNISKMFGRKIGIDIESFRWVSNLENVHKLFNEESLESFLKDLNNVNNIRMIHDYEGNQLNF